jgi:nitroimidazol reductase NimA-like FMN-containing flavoprotein (pyridoxamine 5'-phosphate oxidase superfamily)
MKPSGKTKVKRAPKRGHYDSETIYQILDADFVCQVAFIHNDHPVVIPTIYGRFKNDLYIHGATVSRMLLVLEKGIPISVNITKTDGLVLARSAFHHSLNYRSVTIFGNAVLVTDETERIHALKVISDQIIPGRWEEAREPNKKELKATKIIKIPITEASAKIRSGPPVDEKADYDLPIWAGVVPISEYYGEPVTDSMLRTREDIPGSVVELLNNKNG